MSPLFTSGGHSTGTSASSPSNEYSGLIYFRIDWFDLHAVQWTLKSLHQDHSTNSILQCSAFFIVQFSHLYMANGKTIALYGPLLAQRCLFNFYLVCFTFSISYSVLLFHLVYVFQFLHLFWVFFFWWGGVLSQVFIKCSIKAFVSVQFSSIAQSCPTLCDRMNRSTPGLPVHHQLLEFTQTHVHRVSDAIQASHPLSSPSPPAPNPSQHQSLFQ